MAGSNSAALTIAAAEPPDLERLLARLDRLPPEELHPALRYLARLKSRASIPALLRVLERGQPGPADEAAQTIATIGGGEASAGLLALVEQSPALPTRRAAVYALAWLFEPRAFPVLMDRFCDSSEDVQVRAQAAEGSIYLLRDADIPSSDWRRAVGIFLAGLDDPEPRIRYWSVCAVRSMRLHSAVPKLRVLAAEDSGGDPEAGWSVRDEAEAVLAIFEPELGFHERAARSA